MAEQILSDIIGNRDVLSMSVSAAKQIIAEFYLAMEIATVGYYDQHKMDFYCQRALKNYGLDLIA